MTTDITNQPAMNTVNTELTAATLREANDLATAQALEDYGPADGGPFGTYIDTYTVRVDGLLTYITVDANGGHYCATEYEYDYSESEGFLADESDLRDLFNLYGSDRALAVASYLADAPDLVDDIRDAIAERDDVAVHRPEGTEGECIYTFPYESERAIAELVEELAVTYAMAATNFFDRYESDRVAPAIIESLPEDATRDEFLDAAIAEMQPDAERAEAFLWAIGEGTPWAQGAGRAAKRFGYEIHLEADGFTVVDR